MKNNKNGVKKFYVLKLYNTTMTEVLLLLYKPGLKKLSSRQAPPQTGWFHRQTGNQ